MKTIKNLTKKHGAVVQYSKDEIEQYNNSLNVHSLKKPINKINHKSISNVDFGIAPEQSILNPNTPLMSFERLLPFHKQKSVDEILKAACVDPKTIRWICGVK